jgi:hypothetical protein
MIQHTCRILLSFQYILRRWKKCRRNRICQQYSRLPEELSPVNLEDIEERTSPLSAATSAAAHVAPAAPAVHAAATAHAAAAAVHAAATPPAPLTST